MNDHNQTQQAASGLHGCIDIGSSKISCAIIRFSQAPLSTPVPLAGQDNACRGPYGGQMPEIIGWHSAPCTGVSGGAITDFTQVSAELRAAWRETVRMAGSEQIGQYCVTVSGGRIRSTYRRIELVAPSPDAAADDEHGEAAQLRQVLGNLKNPDSLPLHFFPYAWEVNGRQVAQNEIRPGQKVSISLHRVSTNETALRQTLGCVRGAVTGAGTGTADRATAGERRTFRPLLIAAPYASALGVLNEAEAMAGAAVIDLGAETSKLAVFERNLLLYADMIAIGGQTITRQIALQKNCSLPEAEQLKRSAVSGRDPVVTAVVQVVIERIFNELDKRMKLANDGAGISQPHLVLTGGSAALAGLEAIAARQFPGSRRVRIAGPRHITGQPGDGQGGGFASLTGAMVHFSWMQCNGLVHVTNNMTDLAPQPVLAAASGQPATPLAGSGSRAAAYIKRVGDWIRVGV